MDKRFVKTVKWHLSYNRQVILKSFKNLLPTLRLRRSYAGTIEACCENEWQQREGLANWWEITIREIKKYNDFDVV